MGKWIIYYGACILIVLSAYSDQSSMNDFRIFTAADGRVIEAKIIACEPARGKVQIERSNRKKVWVQADIFSEEDQNYIREWITADQFMSNSKFRISAEKQKEKKSSSGTPVYYEMTLDNRTSIPLESLMLDYRIMVEEKGYSGHKDSERVVAGKIKLDTLPAGQSIKKKTENVLLVLKYTTQTEITYYSDGSSDADISKNKIREDKVAGIWLKIKGPKVDGVSVEREFCFPSDLSKNFSWLEKPRSQPAYTASGSNRSKAIALKKEAILCRNAKGEERNIPKAIELYKQAYALYQEPYTAFEVGNLYLWEEPYRNYGMAREWLDIAIRKKYYRAHLCLAEYYYRGYDHSARDAKKAVYHAEVAVKLGKKESRTQSILASAYAYGGLFRQAAQAQEKAIKLFKVTDRNKKYFNSLKTKLEQYKQKTSL